MKNENLEKDINAFEYLPKVIPILDILFITWVALNSPQPWVTTPIHISMPIVGLLVLHFFKNKGQFGFYMVGIILSSPIFILNLWGSQTTPTWLAEFAFLAGGLLLAKSLLNRIVVLAVTLSTTIIPLLLNNNPVRFIITIVVAEIAIWFLLERSFKFMAIQQAKIEKQKELVEEKQKEIIDSIHYAKRIQIALLPSEKYIARRLNNK